MYRQFGVDPAKASDNVTIQAFRSKVLRELKKIKLAWPDLNYGTARGVLILYPSRPLIPPAPARPEFSQAGEIRGVFHEYSGHILNPDLRVFGSHSPKNLRVFGSHIQVVRQVVKEQVVGATGPVETKSKNPKPGSKAAPGRAWRLAVYEGKEGTATVENPPRGCTKERFCNARPRRLPQQDRFVRPRDRLSRTSDYFMSLRKLRAKLV